MLRFFSCALLALSLATCAGPQALAQPMPVSESALSQPMPAHAIGAVAPDAVPASIAPIENPDGSWNFVPLMNGLLSFVLAILAAVGAAVAAWVGQAITKYLGVHIDLKEVAKDTGMSAYAETAVEKALAYARQKTGLDDASLRDVQLRNPYLALAAGFIFKQYPEVWTWISKGETGVMQWIEAHLDAAAAIPTKTVEGVGVVPAV